MSVIEEAKIVLEDGTQLKQWTSYSIDSDFLTPTDGWSFTVADQRLHIDAAYSMLQPDKRIEIWIDGTLQMTGIIDAVDWQSSVDGGTTCTVTGRDVLRTLCKANIWPGFAVKKLTVTEVVERVLGIYYPDNTPTLFTDNKANRQVTGLTGSFSPKDRSAMQKKIIESAAAHPNEGAFEFIARNIRRHGLWMWATADGNVVVSGPEYDQEPSYIVSRQRGNRGANWPTASYRYDRTNVPSYVVVRGKATAKEWEKTDVNASFVDKGGTEGLIEPAYIQTDEAKDKEQCGYYAAQEMSRLKENERVYTVTAVGHRDRVTGNMFAIDTLASIDDEFTGVRETMYVAGRTFRKDNSGGTTTELRCVPLGQIQFSDLDAAGLG